MGAYRIMTYNRGRSMIAMIVIAIASCKKDESTKLFMKTTGSQPSITQCSDVKSQRLPINVQEATIVTAPIDLSVQFSMDTVDAQMASRIFRDLQSKGTSVNGSYFSDGQFAYVGNQRRYIQNNYDLVCGKLFLFGDVTGVSARSGCCAAWDYDVACVLWAKEGGLYILDPRLFTRVVKQDEWIEAHSVPTFCQPHPTKTPQGRLVPGNWFAPTNPEHTNYIIDSNYRYTDMMVEYYADSVGCHCHHIIS